MMGTKMMRRLLRSPDKFQPNVQEEDRSIGDPRFINQLRQVQDLKSFLFEEKVMIRPDELNAFDLGPLNNLRYRAHGRAPNPEEWQLLDGKLSILASHLTDELRQKLRIRELSFFFGPMPLFFLSGAIVAILVGFLNPFLFEKNSFWYMVIYLGSLFAWSLSQGGLGACAFLGTRVTVRRADGASTSEAFDEGADITDRNVLKIRIILGCLFAFLIGLPLSTAGLHKLFQLTVEKVEFSASDFAVIAVPFLVGFSTKLVLTILNRAIMSIRTFFGIAGASGAPRKAT